MESLFDPKGRAKQKETFDAAVDYVSKVTGCDAGSLRAAARACEEIEAVVKFVPRSGGEGPESDIVEAAKASWVSAAGSLIWGRGFTGGDFAEGTSYPTFVTGVLALARLAAECHPSECTAGAFDLVAQVFRQRPTLGGGKDGETGCTEKQNRGIKEQCIRFFLYVLPVYPLPVLDFLKEESDTAGNLDESLVRYLVSNFNQAFPGPFPQGFVTELERFLKHKHVVQALARGGVAVKKLIVMKK